MVQSGEDAASVLDSFIHDVANLPAEITHLMEELQAKHTQLEECRTHIHTRDHSLQKYVKQHGGHVKHPSEEKWNKSVLENFERASALQDEKVVLANKASFLVRYSVMSIGHVMEMLILPLARPPGQTT